MAVDKRTWTTKSGETRMAWVVRYYDAGSKFRTKTFKRERDAKEWEAQVKVDLKKGIHQPDSTSITVGKAADLWLERARAEQLEPDAIASYERQCRLHIKPATVPRDVPNGWDGELGDVKLSRLTTPLCDAFRLQLLTSKAWDKTGKISAGKIRTDKTISRRMARHILASFKAILTEAQKRGLLALNPAQPIRIDPKKRERVPIRIGEQIPDRPDVRAILAAATGLWHPLFFAAAFTGMRSSELRALIWPNVDLDGCVIHVRQRADTVGKIGPCKSEAGYRDIQISNALADELRGWKLICPPGSLDLVFPNGRGTVIFHTDIISGGWHAVQHRIEMERPNGQAKYSFHSLRHFYASIMIAQGTPPKRLQSLLGHATLAMTMDTYGHLFPAGDDETVRINSAVESVLNIAPTVLRTMEAESLMLATTRSSKPAEFPTGESAVAETPPPQMLGTRCKSVLPAA